MSIKVLLVGDDFSVSESIQKALRAADCVVSSAQTDEEAFIMASVHRFDVIVLDLSLPLRCGMELLPALRKLGQDLPILILSALAEVELRVAALRQGADDFLPKPFSLVELEIRLNALLRRGKTEEFLQVSDHDLTLDANLRHVTRGNHTVELTRLEFDLLQLLARRAHQVVSRAVLVREVWKGINRATPIDNLIDVHIGRLRKKIDTTGRRPLIHTVRGVGFMLSERGPRIKDGDTPTFSHDRSRATRLAT